MPGELVRVNQSGVTWSHAVAEIASALNPLGHAAEIVAQIAACTIEIRKIEVELRRINAQRALIEQGMEYRHRTIMSILGFKMRELEAAELTAEELRLAFRESVRVATDRSLPLEHMELAQEFTKAIGQMMQNHHTERHEALIELGKSLIGRDPFATGSPYPEIER